MTNHTLSRLTYPQSKVGTLAPYMLTSTLLTGNDSLSTSVISISHSVILLTVKHYKIDYVLRSNIQVLNHVIKSQTVQF